MKLGLVSCLKIQNQKDQDEVWKDFVKAECEALLVMGDCYYMKEPLWRKLLGRSYFNHKDMFNRARSQWGVDYRPPSLSALISKIGFRNLLTTWDDHDHQGNNKGGAYNKRTLQDRAKAKQVFVNTFKHLPIKRSEAFGVEYSRTFSKEKIVIVMLDTRYYRSKKEMLGARQWAWFKNVVLDHPNHQLVLVSSSTLDGKDGWRQYPEERRELLQVLATNQELPLILSGDIHRNKVTKHYSEGKFVTELTSSGVRDNKYNRGIIEITGQGASRVVYYELKAKGGKLEYLGSLTGRK